METKLLEEVLECLRGERTVFSYHRDAYAIYLLQRAFLSKEAIALHELRSSHWASLLNRPMVKEIVAHCGNGYLSKGQLSDRHISRAEPYVLTVGSWGNAEDYRWSQVSRPGSNLVLQLNLCNRWQKEFESLIGQTANSYFGYSHPLSHTRAMTLAWSRLDIDFNTNEVLVEEIQTDLVRLIMRMRLRALASLECNSDVFQFFGARINADEFCEFAERFLSQFKTLWHEAILTATLKFAFEELGVAQLFYHTFETGSELKNINYTKPPRSLYTELPEKFCFSQTSQPPKFLQQDKKVRRKLSKIKNCRWFYMAA